MSPNSIFFDPKEAKAEYEDYDEKILEALKQDFPQEKAKAEKQAAQPAKKEAEKSRFDTMPPEDENDKPLVTEEALEAHLATLPQTKALHTNDKGEYTTERQTLHEKIVTEEVEDSQCIKRDAPIAILTGGLPGSGKSTYIRKNRDWIANPALFKIDSDEVREKLPEYQGWNAAQTHEESRDIVNSLVEKVGRNGCSYDVVYDGTMNKARKYKPLIEKLKKEGYQVFVLYLQVDEDTSLKRVQSRYQKTGRYVPRPVIKEAAANGLEAFNEIKGMVDGYVLVDGVSGKVLEKGGQEIPKDRDYANLAGATPEAEPKKKATSKPAAYSWKKAEPVAELKPASFALPTLPLACVGGYRSSVEGHWQPQRIRHRQSRRAHHL